MSAFMRYRTLLQHVRCRLFLQSLQLRLHIHRKHLALFPRSYHSCAFLNLHSHQASDRFGSAVVDSRTLSLSNDEIPNLENAFSLQNNMFLSPLTHTLQKVLYSTFSCFSASLTRPPNFCNRAPGSSDSGVRVISFLD